jgi:hypothetical protein
MRLASGPWRGESRRGAVRCSGSGGNDGCESLLAQSADLGRVPIAAVGQHDLQFLVDAGGTQDTQGVVGRRFQLLSRWRLG